jgi:hypothetical protein
MDLHVRPQSAISISRTSPDYIRTEKQNFVEDHTFNSCLANLVEIINCLNKRGSSSLDLNISEL